MMPVFHVEFVKMMEIDVVADTEEEVREAARKTIGDIDAFWFVPEWDVDMITKVPDKWKIDESELHGIGENGNIVCLCDVPPKE